MNVRTRKTRDGGNRTRRRRQGVVERELSLVERVEILEVRTNRMELMLFRLSEKFLSDSDDYAVIPPRSFQSPPPFPPPPPPFPPPPPPLRPKTRVWNIPTKSTNQDAQNLRRGTQHRTPTQSSNPRTPEFELYPQIPLCSQSQPVSRTRALSQSQYQDEDETDHSLRPRSLSLSLSQFKQNSTSKLKLSPTENTNDNSKFRRDSLSKRSTAPAPVFHSLIQPVPLALIPRPKIKYPSVKKSPQPSLPPPLPPPNPKPSTSKTNTSAKTVRTKSREGFLASPKGIVRSPSRFYNLLRRRFSSASEWGRTPATTAATAKEKVQSAMRHSHPAQRHEIRHPLNDETIPSMTIRRRLSSGSESSTATKNEFIRLWTSWQGRRRSKKYCSIYVPTDYFKSFYEKHQSEYYSDAYEEEISNKMLIISENLRQMSKTETQSSELPTEVSELPSQTSNITPPSRSATHTSEHKNYIPWPSSRRQKSSKIKDLSKFVDMSYSLEWNPLRGMKKSWVKNEVSLQFTQNSASQKQAEVSQEFLPGISCLSQATVSHAQVQHTPDVVSDTLSSESENLVVEYESMSRPLMLRHDGSEEIKHCLESEPHDYLDVLEEYHPSENSSDTYETEEEAEKLLAIVPENLRQTPETEQCGSSADVSELPTQTESFLAQRPAFEAQSEKSSKAFPRESSLGLSFGSPTSMEMSHESLLLIPSTLQRTGWHIPMSSEPTRSELPVMESESTRSESPVVESLTPSTLLSPSVSAMTMNPSRELVHAATLGFVGQVEMLLSSGNEQADARGPSGAQALRRAAEAGFADVVRVLLKYGADPDQPDEEKGWLPLHYAASSHNPSCVQVLLDAGASVAAVDYKLRTALFVAVLYERHQSQDLLLAAGADLMASDVDGLTPFQYYHTVHDIMNETKNSPGNLSPR